MSKTKEVTKIVTKDVSLIPKLTVIFAIIAWFVYGSFNGVAAIVAISFALGYIGLLGLIPVAGIFLYIWAGKWTITKIAILAGIKTTWLTGLILAAYGISAAIISFITTIITIVVILAVIAKLLD